MEHSEVTAFRAFCLGWLTIALADAAVLGVVHLLHGASWTFAAVAIAPVSVVQLVPRAQDGGRWQLVVAEILGSVVALAMVAAYLRTADSLVVVVAAAVTALRLSRFRPIRAWLRGPAAQ